jgi:ATP-dependent protease Clp ATPase subunit
MPLRTLKRVVSPYAQLCPALADVIDVGEDVENCVLRLLQAAEYDINRTE